jgi:branched-chain amino acid transport system permease protein
MRKLLLPLALLVLALSAPFWLIQTTFVLSLFIQTFIFMAAAIAWNIISGFGGQLSFGHSVFFGLGAYTSPLLFINFGLSPWFGLVPAGLLAALAAVLIGLPSFRLQGIYFTLVTFAFTLILVILAGHFDGLTGGHVGLSVPFRRGDVSVMQFENRVWFYYVVLALVVVCFVVSALVLRSRLGYWLRAIRDDEVAAEACGINTMRTKMIGLVISAFLTGLAGVLYSQFTLFIDPEGAFGLATASLIALPAIAGGLGSLWGPVLGALLLVPLEQFIDDSFEQAPPGLSLVVYAAIIILVVLLDRGGIVNLLSRLRKAVSRAGAGARAKPSRYGSEELAESEVGR